jgi:GT2 family glycosyltransferase
VGAHPSLSVIVPATDDPATLPACRAALEPALADGDELIVVTDEMRPGPAAARNAAAARAAGEVLVFVDADVVIAADALARIRGAFAADPALGALFGSYDDSPVDPGRISRFRNLLHHHVHSRSAGPASTFWAGLGAIRREEFDEQGGFDAERYAEPSVEDIELGMRLAAAGVPIRLDPGVRGTHLKRWGLRSMLRTDLLRRGIPWVELVVERGGPGGPRALPLNLALGNLLSAAAACTLLASVLARKVRPALGALAILAALNGHLYLLLLRRGGAAGLLTGLPLHVAHLVAAAASVPPGVIRGLRRRCR